MSEEKKSEEEVIKTGYKIGYGLIFAGAVGSTIAALTMVLMTSKSDEDILRIFTAFILSCLLCPLGWVIVLWLKKKEY